MFLIASILIYSMVKDYRGDYDGPEGAIHMLMKKQLDDEGKKMFSDGSIDATVASLVCAGMLLYESIYYITCVCRYGTI